MRLSHRARRLQRRSLKSARAVPLNIVSMIDIFAILVFFLLITYWAADVVVLQSKDVRLPESVALDDAQRSVTVTISPTEILVEGRRILTVADAEHQEGEVLPALQTALGEYVKPITGDGVGRAKPPANAAADHLIVVGDKRMSYQLLKKVMRSGAEAGYSDIQLAVLQQEPEH